jgi:tetratricopeptide (TPR) repeat protein
VFDKLAKFKKAPYKYKIHANIELAKNFSKDSSSTALIERMQKLIKNRDNRPYLDELLYQVGVLHETNDSVNIAISYYNKSLRAIVGSDQQKTYTYEKLGNLYFKNAEYLLASSYYDSVLSISKDKNELRIRRVKRKHKNLASLIKFENTVVVNDSILKIVSLSKEAQTIYFENYIEKIKKENEEKAQLLLNQLAFAGSTGNSLQSSNQGKWYFYNSQSLDFGKTEFKKIWGDRGLEDNWRWSVNNSTSSNAQDSVAVIAKDTRYDLASYLQTIPTDKNVIDSLKIDRNLALYELGLIYKEQFKNSQKAIQRLERVASLDPEEKLILPINWHLYQIYTNQNDLKGNKYKNKIITDYSDTKFAQIIKNPNKNIEEKIAIDQVESSYKEMYYLYKGNKFEETVVKIDEIVATIPDSKFIPKFELLKAYAIGKHKDKIAYKIAMEYVAVSYGSTEEGRKAKEIVEQLNR